MIKIRDLKRNFREYNFEIDCANLTVGTGECFGIYGDTASGKTLFSQIVSGVIRNYSGSIEIGVTEVRSTYRKKIGYLPYRNILYNDLTVKEISMLLLSQYKISESEFDLKLEWFSQFFELKGLISRKIHSLTDGQLQKVKFFISLIHSPSVLIIDEPFNGIGDESIDFINEVTADIAKREVTVLALSCNREFLKKITGGITAISSGKIE